MGAIEHLTIRLSAESAERLRARIKSGGYVDASSVVEDALEALDTLDDASTELSAADEVEIIRIYDEMKRDPSRGIPLDVALAQLKADRTTDGR